uniref:Uncharacterized protein n=1 Tax=Trichogramma kaykai TaxID=54128 RepID=A0ABD2WA54_9HYME
MNARFDRINERLDIFAQKQRDQDVAIANNTTHITELDERLFNELREIQRHHTLKADRSLRGSAKRSTCRDSSNT